VVLRAVTFATLALVAIMATASNNARAQSAGGRRLIFDATFGGHTLDTALWHTCYASGTCRIATNPEYEWYQRSGVSVAAGVLSLTARAQETHGEPFSSGMIQSNGRFDFEYGYIVVKAKIPAGYGTWPALWLLPADGAWPPEIDIMEYWGWAPDQIRESLFTPEDPFGVHHVVDVAGLTAGFHTFAVDWEPGVVSWYLDGHLEFSLHQDIDMLMYPIANLAVSAPPSELTSGTFPATFQIKYIRVYQYPGVGSYVCSSGCPAA
jgi:beta-glucanase (GH16 family)